MNRMPGRCGQINGRKHNSLESNVTYDDVDTAHLLRNHHSPRGESRTTDSRDGEELSEALEVVGVPNNVHLDFDLSIDVIEVPSSK